jgi:hypothetical protein
MQQTNKQTQPHETPNQAGKHSLKHFDDGAYRTRGKTVHGDAYFRVSPFGLRSFVFVGAKNRKKWKRNINEMREKHDFRVSETVSDIVRPQIASRFFPFSLFLTF